MKNSESADPIDEIIRLGMAIKKDVHRSLQLQEGELPKALFQKILKSFTLAYPKISYFQGMNYQIGHIYLLSKDVVQTLQLYSALVQQRQLKVFEGDLKNIRLMFYQIDCCVKLFLPKLALHLKQGCSYKRNLNEEVIDSSQYAAPWIITIFSLTLQYIYSSYFLNNIWDVFVAKGWKALVRVTLFLLKYNEHKLYSMRFDEIVNFLTESGKSSFNLIFLLRRPLPAARKGCRLAQPK